MSETLGFGDEEGHQLQVEDVAGGVVFGVRAAEDFVYVPAALSSCEASEQEMRKRERQ
jgi:hypothetical protein